MTSALDAYQPPTPAPDDTPPKPARVGRIKAIAVIAIVFGVLGLLSALGGIAGLLFAHQIQGAVSAPNQGGMPSDMAKVQADMQKDLQAIQDRYMLLNAVLVALTFFVSLGLLIGGIQCLRRAGSARKILITACSAAFLLELLGGVAQVAIQSQTIPMTMMHMERMMEGGNGPAEVAEVAMTVTRVMIVVGIVFGVLWLLAKLIFFGISVWYLRRPSVCAYLDTPANTDSPFAMEVPQ